MIGRWLMNKVLDPLPVWLQVFIVFAIFSPVVWNYTFATKEAAFVFHNHVDRPIHDVNLNGKWIGGAAAHNGNLQGTSGGAICCGTLDSGEVELTWTVSVTQSQHDAGLRKYSKSLLVKVPERPNEELYLHVHVFADDIVRLVWSESTESSIQIKQSKDAFVNVIEQSY